MAVNKRYLREKEILQKTKLPFTFTKLTDDKKLYQIEIDDIKIFLTKDYPFKRPIVLINNQPYLHYLGTITAGNKNLVMEFKNEGIICLCCKSILCERQWSPIKKIMDIYLEIKRNKEFIERMKSRSYVEMICNNYDIYCFELIDYIKKYI